MGVYKTVFYAAGISALLWVSTVSAGCAGVELGGKAGFYAVDQREEVQTTKSRSKPLKCLWSAQEGC
jgi:hypothetical protein